MAKRNAANRARSRSAGPKRTQARRLGKRPTAKKHISRPASKGSIRTAKKGGARAAAKKGSAPAPARKVALSRQTAKRKGPTPRRAAEPVTGLTPPSSLNMNRRGSAARTGRAEIYESRLDHRGMSPEITAGDVDVDVEDAYFTGDEAPGGDNPTPDQDVVDDIGKALGVEYQDAEELKAGDKVVERDRHRWELDPASSEDYKDRK
jgi:hypothetical protein